MNEDDRPARHPSVETAVFETEVVIYDDRSGMVHHLNPSASSIWLLLDGRPLAAVIDALTQSPGMTLYRWVVQVYAGPFCGVLSGQLAHTAMSKVIVSLPMSPIAPLPCRVLPKKIVDEEVVRQCQSPSLKMLPTSVPPPDNGPHVVPGP